MLIQDLTKPMLILLILGGLLACLLVSYYPALRLPNTLHQEPFHQRPDEESTVDQTFSEEHNLEQCRHQVNEQRKRISECEEEVEALKRANERQRDVIDALKLDNELLRMELDEVEKRRELLDQQSRLVLALALISVVANLLTTFYLVVIVRRSRS